MSYIDLSFDQNVVITESFYPNFSPLAFLTMMGGALGLWLGMGVLQVLHVLASCWKIALLGKRKDFPNMIITHLPDKNI